MSGFVSCSALDILPIQATQVIASFSDQGKVKPIYIHWQDINMKVLSYQTVSESRISVEFNCIVSDGYRERPLYVTYYKTESVWAIDRETAIRVNGR